MRVLFMGRKPVAARLLEHIADHPGVDVVGVLTDSHLEDSATTKAARELGLRLLDFDDATERAEMGDLHFDIGLSVLYWRKLTLPLIAVPRHGVINFHPAPLPGYKGVGGYNLAILDDLPHWGVSAHYVDENIDTGPIIAGDRFPIDRERETARSLEAKSMEALEAQFRRIWSAYVSEPRLFRTTPNEGGRYLSRRELEAMKRIDLATDDVERKARAFWFPPYDGAYIEHGGERFTLAGRAILDDMAEPGTSSLFSPAVREAAE